MNPKISVIVPVYKVEQFLPRCIDSILNQTFTDFELLLIDDGSPDNSGVICNEYALKDKRIRVFHKENGGVSSARNLGLDNAKGEWIYFTDADDELFEDCLETLFSKQSDTFDCITGGYVETNKNDYRANLHQHIEKIWSYKKALLDFYQPIYLKFNGYLWNRLFRHTIIIKNTLRFHEDIYYKEDGLFLVEFICRSKKDIFVTTKPVYKYFINPQGAMQSIKFRFEKKYLTNMDARILCWENIKNATKWYDFRLRFESQRCITRFYSIINSQIEFHKINDDSILSIQYKKMKEHLSIFILCAYKLKRFYNKVNSAFLCRKQK